MKYSTQSHIILRLFLKYKADMSYIRLQDGGREREREISVEPLKWIHLSGSSHAGRFGPGLGTGSISPGWRGTGGRAISPNLSGL